VGPDSPWLCREAIDCSKEGLKVTGSGPLGFWGEEGAGGGFMGLGLSGDLLGEDSSLDFEEDGVSSVLDLGVDL